ncbi:hypothetical protein BHM03_00042141 [Ensete ventricosum]|nr:hypothetical protein BHM03_00042141 [Ensete ventricosum]
MSRPFSVLPTPSNTEVAMLFPRARARARARYSWGGSHSSSASSPSSRSGKGPSEPDRSDRDQAGTSTGADDDDDTRCRPRDTGWEAVGSQHASSKASERLLTYRSSHRWDRALRRPGSRSSTSAAAWKPGQTSSSAMSGRSEAPPPGWPLQPPPQKWADAAKSRSAPCLLSLVITASPVPSASAECTWRTQTGPTDVTGLCGVGRCVSMNKRMRRKVGLVACDCTLDGAEERRKQDQDLKTHLALSSTS